MKKAEQIKINAEVIHAMRSATIPYGFDSFSDLIWQAVVTGTAGKPLRNCNAKVYAFRDMYVLKSYQTPIAFIDSDGICYDFLRYAYGYTSTSAKHISIFMADYHATEIRRYYPIDESNT